LVNANRTAKYKTVSTSYGDELTGTGISNNIWSFEIEEMVTGYNLGI